MLTENYILLIFNCYKYREKAIKQKETWLKNIDMLYFHVLGDPDLSTDFYFDISNHILLIKCEDDYNSLPKKVIRAYIAISDTYHFKYIFKTDDDQHVEPVKFLSIITKILDNKNPKVHYGGKIVDINIPYKSEYYKIHPELPKDIIVNATKYCSGRFYFLSWEAVFNLSNKKVFVENEYLEDYAIGFHLSSYLKKKMLDITVDKYFKDF
jgi:hypothetical protein